MKRHIINPVHVKNCHFDKLNEYEVKQMKALTFCFAVFFLYFDEEVLFTQWNSFICVRATNYFLLNLVFFFFYRNASPVNDWQLDYLANFTPVVILQSANRNALPAPYVITFSSKHNIENERTQTHHIANQRVCVFAWPPLRDATSHSW